MKGTFDSGSFSGFMNGLVSGNSALHDIVGDIKIKKADAWDGENGKPLDDPSEEL